MPPTLQPSGAKRDDDATTDRAGRRLRRSQRRRDVCRRHGGGAAALAPLRAIGKPIADVLGPHPFAGWQQAFDPLLTPGARNYWKTHDFAELSDELIDTVLGYLESLPDPQSEIFFAQVGGAQSRVPDDATAYQGRSAAYVVNVHGRWADAAQDSAGIAW